MLDKVQCVDYLDLLVTIPDESIDTVITDPPFGISYQNNYTAEKHPVLQGDDTHFSYSRLAKECFRVLRNNTPIFVYTGWSKYPYHYCDLEKAGFSMKEPIICQKRASGKTDLYGSFQSNADWILFGHKGRFKFRKTELVRNRKAGIIPNKGRKPVPEYKTRLPSCWFSSEYPWSTENSSFQKKHNIRHPTIKSVEFARWLVLLSTDEDDVVLDPFLGTGTTAIAAQKTGRHFWGGDINPEYCKMSCKRLGQSPNGN